MNNSKLVNVLRTFSKSEMKEFEKLVSSPFFNMGRNYMPFLNELKKFYPRFEDEKMTPEYIYSKMYHGKKFNKQIIWNMSSAVLNMAEEYLIHVSLKKDKIARNNQVAEELHERKLSDLFRKKMDEIEKELDKIGIGSFYFQYKARLESGRIHHLFLEDQQHHVPRHIAKRGDFTILDFLRVMSGVIGDIKSNQKMFNASFEINIPYEFIKNLGLGKIIDYVKEKNYRYADFMEMYYCSIMMVITPEDLSYFHILKKLVLSRYSEFTVEERKWWITALTNYCVEISEEHNNFRNILFELNQLQLKEIESSRKKDLGKILYIQILRNALAIGETEWSKKFIEKYTQYLKYSYQKSMRALANSFFSIKLKDYNKVIDYLKTVKFIDTRDKLFVRSLYLMSYYELNEIPALLYYLDSTKQFISSNPSIAINTRKNYSTFLTCLSRLITSKEKYNGNEPEKLRNEIEMDKNIVNRKWLLEKIEELKSKRR